MTKKQQAALQRIINRETARNNENGVKDHGNFVFGGVHPVEDGYVITDGYVAVYYHQKPEGFADASQADSLGRVIMNERNNGNHTLIEEKFPLDDWKKLARQAERSGATARVTIGPAQDTDFNPRLVVDAMEAIGTGALAYLGRIPNARNSTLLIYPKNWMDNPDSCSFALVLPLRRRK